MNRDLTGGEVPSQGSSCGPKWSLLCHHDPQRSFGFRGRLLPLCSRCMGFWGALPLFFAVGLFLPHLPGVEPLKLAALYILSLIPLGVDGFTQYMGWRESTNTIRFLTGLIAGSVGGIILAYLVRNIISVVL